MAPKRRGEGSSRGGASKRKAGEGQSSNSPQQASVPSLAAISPEEQEKWNVFMATRKDKDVWKYVIERADRAVANFFYRCCIPFSAAKSPHYKYMMECISAMKGNYNPPSYDKLRTKLLDDQVEEVKKMLEYKKRSFGIYGCTLMTDGWRDARRREYVNFIVSSGLQTIFLKTIDVTDAVRNSSFYTQAITDVIEEVGASNVVQIITDNATACVKAGREIEDAYPHIIWTPCAAHSLDLILEDLGKVEWIKAVVASCEKITKFIYNHNVLLSLFLRQSKGKEIVRLGQTRFMSNFLALQRLLEAKVPLGYTFISEEWTQSDQFQRLRTSSDGIEVAMLVKETLEPLFDNVKEVLTVCEPLVRVRCLVDGDQLSMPYIYEAMERAKESIKRYYEADQSKFQPIWDIIDKRWNKTLHKPIHGCAHILNPQFFFEPTFDADDDEVNSNVISCIAKMVPDFETRTELRQEIVAYKGHSLTWSNDAMSSRFIMRPDVWWDQFCLCLPTLRKFARRILVQPTSASACERNWSMFNHTQAKKRHLLHSKRLKDLMFVNFNLLLEERQQRGKVGDVICLEKLSLLPPTVDAEDDDDDDEASASSPPIAQSPIDLCDEHDDVDDDEDDDDDWAA